MLDSRITLWIQIGVAVLLAAGAVLAKLRWYRAHGACQGAAYLVTLSTTALWMAPVFASFFVPNLTSGKPDRTDLIVTAHASLGTLVLLLGAYVILVAATPLVPARLRFSDYRTWMRTLIVLWWIVTALGVWTYWVSA
jgi:hypothetical protein